MKEEQNKIRESLRNMIHGGDGRTGVWVEALHYRHDERHADPVTHVVHCPSGMEFEVETLAQAQRLASLSAAEDGDIAAETRVFDDGRCIDEPHPYFYAWNRPYTHPEEFTAEELAAWHNKHG